MCKWTACCGPHIFQIYSIDIFVSTCIYKEYVNGWTNLQNACLMIETFIFPNHIILLNVTFWTAITQFWQLIRTQWIVPIKPIVCAHVTDVNTRPIFARYRHTRPISLKILKYKKNYNFDTKFHHLNNHVGLSWFHDMGPYLLLF